MQRVLTILLVATLPVCSSSSAQDTSASTQQHENNVETVKKLYKEQLSNNKDDSSKLVLYGLIADKKRKIVTIKAEATGLKANEIVEFFIIGPKSGHGYEALAMSFAQAGDIQKALEFIGMAPGRPVNFSELAFWPKGERLIVSVDSIRVEKFILDSQTKKSLPENGLVFTGSTPIESLEHPGTSVLSADTREPFSVAANYNEPNSVLDLPRRAIQDAVYETQFMHPDHILEPGKLVTITMEPEHKDGTKRVRDLTLTISEAAIEGPPVSNKTARALSALRFTVQDETNKYLIDNAKLNDMLQCFAGIVEADQDPFVSVHYDGAVSMPVARECAHLLASIESDSGIRVEPPSEGQPYFKAFTPREELRPRTRRSSQPWEMIIRKNDDSLAADLVRINETWYPDKIDPSLSFTTNRFTDPKDIRSYLDAALREEFKVAISTIDDEATRARIEKLFKSMSNKQLWGERGRELQVQISDSTEKVTEHKILYARVLFVFVPENITCGGIQRFLAPVLTTHPIVHIFSQR